MFFGYDDAMPVDNEEELRRKQAMDALRNAMAGGTPAPTGGGLLGGGGLGDFMGTGNSQAQAVMNAVGAPRPLPVGKSLPDEPAKVSSEPLSVDAFARRMGFGGVNMNMSLLDSVMESYPEITGPPAPPAPATYRHYSATAEPLTPEVLARRMVQNQVGPGSTFLPSSEFMGPPTPAAVEAPSPRPTIFGMQLPSAWRESGGAMINDGSNRITAPMMSGPGAGYTRQGMDGSITPIAFSTDADYGTRLGMEPYTNPLVQGLIRQNEAKERLQAQQIAGDMARAQVMAGGRTEGKREQAQMKAIQAANNPMLSQASKETVIKGLDLPEDEKNTMRMDTATTTYDTKSRQQLPIGHTNKATGEVDLVPLLSKLPTDIPTDQALKFLEEKRGIDPEYINKLGHEIRVAKFAIPKDQWVSNRYDQQRKTYDLLLRLGFIKPIDNAPTKSGGFFGGGAGFSMGP